MHLVQELSDDDFDRRAKFCETMMEFSNANPDFIRNWTIENLKWIMEANTQHSQKVDIWIRIVRIGPSSLMEC